MIYGANKHSDRQTLFKMSNGNNVKNGNTGKTKPSQQKTKYENRCTCLKVEAGYPLKKIKYICSRIVKPFLSVG